MQLFKQFLDETPFGRTFFRQEKAYKYILAHPTHQISVFQIFIFLNVVIN